MSRRRNGNAIRGPQSALTDFLASHNISAQQINLDYQARMRDAQQQAAQQADEGAAELEEDVVSDEAEDAAERKKRKRKEEKTIAKIKASKDFKRRKFEHHRNNPDMSSDDDALAKAIMKQNRPAPPKPGQFSNCEICEKRFTVTPYTIAGEDGGLLCTKCGKEVKGDRKKAENAAKKKKQVTQKARKRQQESDRMMGDVKPGSKSLVEHCVRKVADVVNDIEEFGDLPQSLLDRLSQILSKKRVLNSRTLQLFLQRGIDRIAVYDCAKLESEDFKKIFAYMPDVERVNLRFAGQLKDEALSYMVEKNPKIKHLQLDATNLVTDGAWANLFLNRGDQLETLKLSCLNDAMKDDTVRILAENCQSLKRLKLRQCPHMTEASLHSIATMSTLEHLSLAVAQECSADALVKLITSLGPNLKTLSLEDYVNADDELLEAIRGTCKNLRKLRLTGSASFTDAIIASLFDPDWKNPPLTFVDLNSNRDLDNQIATNDDNHEQNDSSMIGFGSKALKMLFLHSGEKLERLDLHSNRQITGQALKEVFDGQRQYPNLRDIDLSFVSHVDDVVMTGIFKSCPQLQKLAVFACFSAREAIIPQGIAVIGLPNAQSAVEIIGDA